MEPFAGTSVIVTRNHLAETDLVTVAVSRLAFFVLVIAFVK
jgi:hypothetical protein